MMNRREREAGAAAVELAIIAPVLFMLVFGIIVFGITFFRLQSMQAAVREGGRLAAVRADHSLITDRVWAEQRVVNRSTDPAGLTVTVNRIEMEPADPDNPRRVGVTSGPACDQTSSTDGWGVEVLVALTTPSDYAMSIPFVPAFSTDMGSTAVFRCE